VSYFVQILYLPIDKCCPYLSAFDFKVGHIRTVREFRETLGRLTNPLAVELRQATGVLALKVHEGFRAFLKFVSQEVAPSLDRVRATLQLLANNGGPLQLSSAYGDVSVGFCQLTTRKISSLICEL
jgi:hypothetical protein